MVFVAAVSVALLLTAYAAAHGFACNLRRLRVAVRSAPFDDVALSGMSIDKVPTPRRWPDAEDVGDPATAAAYTSLADERFVTRTIGGELLVVVVAGAVLGAGWRDLVRLRPPGVAIAVAVAVLVGGGQVCRLRATRFWEPVAARYRARYRVLTALPEPGPEPPRRAGLLDRLLRAR